MIQQLYMIPSFRKGILESDLPDKENTLYHMRLLFGKLRTHKRKYYDALKFCDLIKNREGNSLPIYNELDPGEFFSLLLDQLKIDLGKTNSSKLVNEVFGGIFTSEVICNDCPHKYEVKENFISLNLQIKNIETLENALKEYTKTEILSKNAAYYCTKCNMKVNAKARICFGMLPNTLVISLKSSSLHLRNK